MISKTRWAAGAAIVVCLAGCNKLLSRDDDSTAAPPPVQTAAAAATAVAASAEGTGIPECDTLLVAFDCYLKKSGVPNSELSIQQMRDGFKQGAATAAGRSTTAAACKMQLSAQQGNFARVGCSGGGAAPGDAPGAPGGLGGPGQGNLGSAR